jgi:hypothetical protein
MVTVVIAVSAGKDQELPVSWPHVDGVTLAVAPVGNPLSVKVVGVGKLVPAVGVRVSEYVAVPPGVVVCAVPPPVTGVLTAKPVTTWKLVDVMAAA